MSFELPELDEKATREQVEIVLEKYRIFKYLEFEEKETSTTASYDEVGGGRVNTISDQTGSVATANVDQQRGRLRFCERIERTVKRLPKMERFLIEKRYMSEESEYLTDYQVYYFEFQPPVSPTTYAKIRWKAFYKLALNLNIAVLKKANDKQQN